MHALVGAYVMDAIPDVDRADFERHLLTCEQCREDVRGLREATAQLASAAAITPRRELREQTLAAAARIRQLPPLVPGEQAPRLGGWRLAYWRRPASAGRLASARRLARPTGGGARPWLSRVAIAVAGALAATAIVFGLHMSAMQDRLTAAEQRDNAIAAVLGAHDAATLTAKVKTGGTATVVMSHRAHALVFIAAGLTRLPASKAYELWLMGPGGDTPAGMLPPGHHGMTGPMVVDRLAPGEQLGVTVEPAGGSSQPTSVPIVLVALSKH
jgi:anti-sigma-K factor RskA